MSKGKLITFEGGEGAGKGTQIALLREALIRDGYDVSDAQPYEPGSTSVGDIIRILVKKQYLDKEHLLPFKNVCEHTKDQKLTDYTEVCLFMANRAEVYDKIIRPELEAGKIVILDRSVDSTVVYQGHGAKNKELIPMIRNMNKSALGTVKIDRTIVLDVPVEVGQKRMSLRDQEMGDRFQDEKIDYHERLREGYLIEAKEFPDRIRVVDSLKPIEEVHKNVYDSVKSIL